LTKRKSFAILDKTDEQEEYFFISVLQRAAGGGIAAESKREEWTCEGELKCRAE